MAISARIAIIDDEPSVLKSTSALLKSYGFAPSAFASAEAFLDETDIARFDCIVLDVRMPGMNGLELQSELNAQASTVPIVFITAHGDIPMAVEAVRSGAVDFVEKPFEAEQLKNSVDFALTFQPHIRPSDAQQAEARRKLSILTERELEVFSLIAQGETSKSIARILDISPRTVDVHRQRLRDKLQAERLADLIRLHNLAGMR